MQAHIISVLWALTWVLTVYGEKYVPKVKKSTIKGPRLVPRFTLSYPEVARFHNSDTLILTFGDRLHISFDDGAHWETASGIEGTNVKIILDQFHQGRAFVIDKSLNTPELHITEDQGKNWRSFHLPEDTEPNYTYCFPITHPFNRKLVLLHCSIFHEDYSSSSFRGLIAYGSDDAGKSFTPIMVSKPFDFRARCNFTASEASKVKDDGVYCIHAMEEPGSSQVQSSNQSNKEFWEKSYQQKRQSVSTLFYTKDLGKTKKTFDELSGLSVEKIFILPSGVAVMTSDAGDTIQRPQRIWILRDGMFKPMGLPEGIRSIRDLSEDNQGRLLLTAYVKDKENLSRSERLLVADSVGLDFSFQENTPQLTSRFRWKQLGNLKGTLWAVAISQNKAERKVERKLNWLKEIVGLLNFFSKECWLEKIMGLLKYFFSKESYEEMMTFSYLNFVSKGSFDNGKTWTNLRIVDHLGNHRHLFNCNVDDIEHCSFQENPYSHAEKETAGIIIKTGTAGEYNLGFGEDDMTFISRDGGISWEVVFEFPVYAVFLDLGNIIVAMEDSIDHIGLRTRFFFSLDQGRTWEVYYFDKPVHATLGITTRGLKAYVGLAVFKKKSMEYIHYSVDFSDAFGGTPCTKDDRETWYLSNGNCIDGKKYSFDRRKPNAQCLMEKTFETLELHEEACEP